MIDPKEERWRRLAASAAQEQDLEKLLRLIQELNIALDEEQPLTSHSSQEILPTDVGIKS
jgi:hypothetical protein